jgi:Helicase associated domain
VWNLFGTLWEDAFERLSNYKTREGHCLVPINYEENGFPLGRWVFRQRQNKKRIPIERQRRLNTLGFVWRPFDSAWERSFAALMEFKNREGHCRVSQDHIENGINLGRWVSKQRAKRKKMSIERRQSLDALGFVWNVQERTAVDSSVKAQELES